MPLFKSNSASSACTKRRGWKTLNRFHMSVSRSLEICLPALPESSVCLGSWLSTVAFVLIFILSLELLILRRVFPISCHWEGHSGKIREIPMKFKSARHSNEIQLGDRKEVAPMKTSLPQGCSHNSLQHHFSLDWSFELAGLVSRVEPTHCESCILYIYILHVMLYTHHCFLFPPFLCVVFFL